MKPRHAGLPLLIALASVTLPAAAHAGPWLLSPNEYYTEMRGNYFSSDRMWDADGNSVNFSSIATLERRSITSYTEIGWKNWLSLSLDVPFKSRTLRAPSPHAQSTETGLADLTLGARIGLMQGATAVALDVMWKTPFGYDRDAIPPLGAGTNDLIGALSVGSSLPAYNTFLQASGGYRYRIDDRNSGDNPPGEFVGSADVGVWATSGILIAGRYRGFMTLGSSTPAEERSRHGISTEGRFRIDDRLDIFAGWAHVFAGENTVDVDDIYVGVAFRETQLNRLQGFLGTKQAP